MSSDWNSPPESLANSPTSTTTSCLNKFMKNSPMSIQLQIKSLERTISSQKAQIDELESDILEKNKEVIKFTSQVQGLREKIDQLKDENARIPMLRDDIDRIAEELNNMRYQFDQQMKKCNQIRDERDDAKRQLKECEHENIKIAVKLDECRQDFDEFRKKHESCSDERMSLKNEIEKYQREITNLEGSLRKQASEYEQYRIEAEENRRIQREEKEKELEQMVLTYNETQEASARRIKKLEDDNMKMLESKTETIMSLESKIAEMEREIRTLNRKIADHDDELNRERMRANQEIECLLGSIVDKEKYAIELESSRSELERENRHLFDKIKFAEMEAARKQERDQQKIEQTEKLLEERNVELERYKNEVFESIAMMQKLLDDNTKKDESILAMTAEVERLQSENEKAKRHFSEQLTATEQLYLAMERDSRDNMESMAAQISSLKASLNSAMNEMRSKENALKAMENEKKLWSAEKQDLESKVIQLERSSRDSNADRFMDDMRRNSLVSMNSYYSLQHQPPRPSTGMSIQSAPTNQINFDAEDEPTIVMTSTHDKVLYDRQAPAPLVEDLEESEDPIARYRELRDRNRKLPPHLRSTHILELSNMPLDHDVPADILMKPDENTPPIVKSKSKPQLKNNNKGGEDMFELMDRLYTWREDQRCEDPLTKGSTRSMTELSPEISRSRSSQSSSRSFKDKSKSFKDMFNKHKDDDIPNSSTKKTPKSASRKSIVSRILKPLN